MITKSHRHDTMAIIKLTNWKDQNILDVLKQHSTVDNSWFIREVRIGSNLYKTIEELQNKSLLEVELVKTYCFPSEKLRQIRSDVEVGIYD